MADVVIIHTSDKRVAADRLRDAITAAGYGVGNGSKQAPEKQGEDQPSSSADKLASAAAVVVIWSKEALASDLVQSTVKEARRQGKLIEVSMDGIKPVGSAEAEMRVALLSGWRGEPFHPGWQKVQGELKRLCGSARAAPPRPEAARGSADGGGKPSAAALGSAAAAAKPDRGSSRGLPRAIVALAVLLLLSLGAATLWLMVQGPPRAPETSAPARRMPEAAPAVAEQPMPATGTVGLQPDPVEAPAPPTAVPAPVSVAAREEADPPVRAESAKRRESASARRAGASSPASTMRLFCERSGRGTRECRNYLRRAAKEGSSSDRRQTASSATRARAPAVRYKNSNNMRLFCEGAGRGTRECRLFRRRGGAGS